MSNAPHFRVAYPADVRGMKHSGKQAAVYVTFPGEEERELPAVLAIRAEWDSYDAAAVVVIFAASLEVSYP